jgi:hypothetical protein
MARTDLFVDGTPRRKRREMDWGIRGEEIAGGGEELAPGLANGPGA